MRGHHKKAGLALVIGLGLMSSTYAITIGSGSISDPLGDNFSGTPDVGLASITIDSSGTAKFSITYAPGTLLGTASGAFNLDTDRNIGTGWPGVDSAHNDSALMGTDYVIQIRGSSFQGNATVYRYVSAGWMVSATVPVTYLDTTEEATVPLSSLGGGDGSMMNFTAASQTQLSLNAWTGIGDYAPDLGHTPGSVTVVPEVSSTLLLGLGLLSLAGWRRVPRPRTSR